MTSIKSADTSIEIDSEAAALKGSEVAALDQQINTELDICKSDSTMPETDLFEHAVQEHFSCDENANSPEIPVSPKCNGINVSENAVQSSVGETPAKLRSSHDTLDVELSDDDSYYSDDEGSDATSSYVGVTTYRIDGAPNEHWSKEYVWGNKNNLQQRSIHPNDRETHNAFQTECLKLCNSSLSSSPIDDSVVETTLPSASHRLQATITANALLPQLDSRYAYMHGGKDINNSQIICLPHFADLREITDEHFNDILLYLTSLQRTTCSEHGFTVIVDRRKDKWSSLRKVLLRLASKFPGNLKSILVLRPDRFLQRKAADLGLRMIRDQLGSKIQITMLSGVHELKKYMESHQIPEEFGGEFVYDHRTWIRNRMLLEDFSSHAVEIGGNLNEYGGKMGDTELPLDVMVTKTLLQSQQAVAKYHKKKLHSLIETATTLKSTINIPCSGSNPTPASYSLEADTLDSVMKVIEGVKPSFEKCWDKHEEKLRHCLELRQFQQDYDEATSKLSIYQKWNEQQSNHVGTNSSWVEYLINEAERMKESFLESSLEYSLLTTIGGGMIESGHYVKNPIASKCNELERILSNLNQAFESRINFLTRMHRILLNIEELNLWCDRAMSLLAGQGIEKAQNLEGAQQALAELEEFFGKNISRDPVNAESVSTNLENYMNAVNSRFQEVVQLYEKRQAYFQKTITRYSERPVQRVEPSIKADFAAPQNEAKEEQLTSTENSTLSELDQAPESPPRKPSDPEVQLSHVMNELLTTEEAYVKELKTIIEGYGDPIENGSCDNEVPKALKGNRKVLLGNVEEIYAFHSKIFLKDLEECKNTPTLVGKCFTNRKSDFEMYSKYCQNSAKSEQLRIRIGDTHPFFEECKQKLGHLLPLSAYLLKPIQRITKYQLLLKQMLKYSNSVNAPDVQAALDTMLSVLKHVNDSIHRKAIVGYQGDMDRLGALLLQAPFSIQSEHRKVKVKNLTRHRFSKTSQRHLFLFEKELLFCKQQSVDSTDNNLSLNQVTPISTVSGGPKKQCYAVKNSLKLNSVGITETAKGDPKKFEIWYQGREEVYTLLAVSTTVKKEWVGEIKKVLLSLPKIEIKLTGSKDKKKGSKARPRKSQNKKPQSAVNLEKHKSQFEFPTSARVASIRRSASVGKDDRNIITTNHKQETFEPVFHNVCNNEIELEMENTLKRARKSASLPKLNTISPPGVSDAE